MPDEPDDWSAYEFVHFDSDSGKYVIHTAKPGMLLKLDGQYFRISYVDDSVDPVKVGLRSLPAGPGVAVVYTTTTLADLNLRGAAGSLCYQRLLPASIRDELYRRSDSK